MPGGRPSKIDQIQRRRDDGTEVTYGEAFIERIRLGLPHDQAAAASGLDRRAILEWRTKAARAQTKPGRPTANETKYIEFARNLERAEADAELSRLAVIERAAQGGSEVTETHQEYERNAAGVLVLVKERRVVKTLRAEWTAAAWWLERRLPQRYSRRVEHTGPDGGAIPIEDRARALADALTEFQAGVETGKKMAGEAVSTPPAVSTPRP